MSLCWMTLQQQRLQIQLQQHTLPKAHSKIMTRSCTSRVVLRTSRVVFQTRETGLPTALRRQSWLQQVARTRVLLRGSSSSSSLPLL